MASPAVVNQLGAFLRRSAAWAFSAVQWCHLCTHPEARGEWQRDQQEPQQ